MFDFFRTRRRARLRAQPFPADWRRIIERNVALFHALPPADQDELLGHVQVFLAEKHFEGCGGLELTDEIRVTIAAQACILLLHRDTDYYPSLTSVLVYPDSYVVDGPRHVGDGIWEDGPESLLGHTGRRLGALLLSWDDSRRGARDADDGANVVLHEFAHQLDFEDHVTDGTPLLESRRQYLAWARVLGAEFRRLRADVKAGREPLLDEYGATDEAEFFAVATEFFFERPVELRAKRPRLYEQLRTFFRQDPAEYPAAGKPGS